MTKWGFDRLLDELRRDEGLRLSPYLDTMGYLTIGYGRNLGVQLPVETPVAKMFDGISTTEAEYLLARDARAAWERCESMFAGWWKMSGPRKVALANMAFNLGGKLNGFVRMRDCIDDDDWIGAAREAMTSKWAMQVGQRAVRIRTLLLDETTLA